MTTFTLHHPTATAAGNRIRVAATRLLSTLVEWTEEVGCARATEALRRMEPTRVTEAAQLRLHALHCSRHDPRFGADLMAAANRHEHGE